MEGHPFLNGFGGVDCCDRVGECTSPLITRRRHRDRVQVDYHFLQGKVYLRGESALQRHFCSLRSIADNCDTNGDPTSWNTTYAVGAIPVAL